MIHRIWKFCKILLLLVWLLLLLLVGAKLASQNSESVAINLIYWELPQISLGLALAIAFAFGIALGLLGFLPTLMALRLRIRSLRNRLAKAEKRPPLLPDTHASP